MEEAVINASPAAEIAAGAAEEVPAYTVDVVEHVDSGWDATAANFSDCCLEQTAAYMINRWGDSRLCGLVLRGAMTGEPEAAALVVIAAIPIIKKGLAYVKFGPLWRRRDRPARPPVLSSALAAIREEFSGLRGLITRVMPPAEPDLGPQWKSALAANGFNSHHAIQDPRRYLVDLSLPEKDQLASLGAKWRANLRRASPTVEVKEADPLQSLPIFLDLYGAMRDRKDFVDHHRIENLPKFIAAAPPALRPHLFLAYADGQPVAGSIVVEAGDRALVPFSASSAEALPLRAGYALRWAIIGRLRDSPARWLDLGGDEGDDGLRHFKEGNVGRRGRIVEIPGEFDCAGSRLSSAATTAMSWAHDLTRLAPLQRLTRG